MKATIEIEVPAGSEEKAVKVMTEAHENAPSPRASVVFSKSGKGKLLADVTATDFTALRAIMTSVLRDLKVMLDVFVETK